MYSLKNPAFVIDVLAKLRKIRNDVYAVFVGEGDDKIHVTDRSSQLHLTSCIRMLGWRNDIPRIMNYSDVFVFPRIEEPKKGLGLVVVETQAAGLPMFLTAGISDDVIVINELYHLLDLKDLAQWAVEIDSVLKAADRKNSGKYVELMKNSEFDLDKATKNLIYIYEQ